MVQFYTEYHSDTILQPVAGEISFTHHVMIFTRCKNRTERQFYILSVKKFGWSKRVLDHQIDNKTYEKYLLNQTNYDDLPAEKFKSQKILVIKGSKDAHMRLHLTTSRATEIILISAGAATRSPIFGPNALKCSEAKCASTAAWFLYSSTKTNFETV